LSARRSSRAKNESFDGLIELSIIFYRKKHNNYWKPKYIFEIPITFALSCVFIIFLLMWKVLICFAFICSQKIEVINGLTNITNIPLFPFKH
jgi:hypothetical protein